MGNGGGPFVVAGGEGGSARRGAPPPASGSGAPGWAGPAARPSEGDGPAVEEVGTQPCE